MTRWGAPLVGLAANFGMIAGVLYGGWAPGNVWLAFWVESVAVGVVTWLRLRAQEGRRIVPRSWDASRWTPPAMPPRPAGAMTSSFFLPWYGIFTGVAGVFAIATAIFVGVRPDLGLWLPLALVLVRFGSDVTDLVTGQAGPGSGFLALTITRMLCLHLGVILGFGCGIAFLAGGEFLPTFHLGGRHVDSAMLSVLALLALKTVAELVFTTVLVATGRR